LIWHQRVRPEADWIADGVKRHPNSDVNAVHFQPPPSQKIDNMEPSLITLDSQFGV